MPELVVLPPELVTGKKENCPRAVFRIPYLWIESDFLKLRTRCGTTILRFYISLLITI